MIDAAIAHLKALGFKKPEVSQAKKGILVKVRTTKGWVYEKFPISEETIAQIDLWASNHEAAE